MTDGEIVARLRERSAEWRAQADEMALIQPGEWGGCDDEALFYQAAADAIDRLRAAAPGWRDRPTAPGDYLHVSRQNPALSHLRYVGQFAIGVGVGDMWRYFGPVPEDTKTEAK